METKDMQGRRGEKMEIRETAIEEAKELIEHCENEEEK